MNSMKVAVIAVSVALLGYLAGWHDRGQIPQPAVAPPAVTVVSTTVTGVDVDAGNEHGDSLLPDAQADVWVCPMHAHVHSDHPGECPICGMQLVKQEVSAVTAGFAPASDRSAHVAAGAAIALDGAVRNSLSVRVEPVQRGNLQRLIHTVGKIGRIDPTARRNLSPPIPGTLIEVAAFKEGDRVASGDFLFSVGSDELYDLQAQYQQAMRTGRRDQALTLMPQLSALGIDAVQLAELQRGAEPRMPVKVYAPQDGFIFIRRGEAGMEVRDGTLIFSMGSNSRAVEVLAEVYETQWAWVSEGQEAVMRLKAMSDVEFRGRVTRVEPPVGYTNRVLEVRLRFDSDNEALNQGMFAEIDILGEQLHDVVSVPATAVIRTGQGARVVLRHADGSFQSVAVVLGDLVGERVVVKSGLNGDETVVASGQFLLDSESNRLAGLDRLTGDAHAQHAH